MSPDQIQTLINLHGASVTLTTDGNSYVVAMPNGTTITMASQDVVEALNGLAALVQSTISTLQAGPNVGAVANYIASTSSF